MAGISRVLKRVAPERDVEAAVERDPDPLQHVHVKPGHAALDPSDDLPVNAREVSEVLLGPVSAQSRGSDFTAEPSALLARSSTGLGDQS